MPGMVLKFLGHTTVLIKTECLSLVFDPNLSGTICLIQRQNKAVFNPQELHGAHAVLYSNAHYHRMDLKSLKYFKQTAQIVTPLKLGKILKPWFSFHVNELKAGAQTRMGDCTIIAAPALHKGSRGLNFSFLHCLNYIVKLKDVTLFYCGDTLYQGSYFHDLGREHCIDWAILPIDCPGWSNKYMTAAQTLQAFEDLQAKKLIPNCFGAFSFFNKDKDRALKTLIDEAKKHRLDDKLCVLQPGDEVNIG